VNVSNLLINVVSDRKRQAFKTDLIVESEHNSRVDKSLTSV